MKLLGFQSFTASGQTERRLFYWEGCPPRTPMPFNRRSGSGGLPRMNMGRGSSPRFSSSLIAVSRRRKDVALVRGHEVVLAVHGGHLRALAAQVLKLLQQHAFLEAAVGVVAGGGVCLTSGLERLFEQVQAAHGAVRSTL